MRASVACERCRRSKIKCTNNGVDTGCVQCLSKGRECQYTSSAPTGTTRRESISGGQHPSGDHLNSNGETPRKRQKRERALAPSSQLSQSSLDNSHEVEHLLDPRVLTSRVWENLFDIYQQHYAADLPFLHAPTFLEPLQLSNLNYVGVCRPPYSQTLLLAFLTLTASFHPNLVTHFASHVPEPERVSEISRRYYKAARAQVDIQEDTLEWVQAALMLGMYEWGDCKGPKGWHTIGQAIRSAHVLGIYTDDEQERESGLDAGIGNVAREADAQSGTVSQEETFIKKEIERRTYWSCFIMDHYLSGGRGRGSNIVMSEVRIQLPCSENAFRFGREVRTRTLTDILDITSERVKTENGAKVEPQSPEYGHVTGAAKFSNGNTSQAGGNDIRWELGTDESILCHYIRALVLFKKCLKWSTRGGRRQEGKIPPWDDRASLKLFEDELNVLRSDLPRDLTLTDRNTLAHITTRDGTSTPYTLLHVVHLLLTIILHREYIPFVANCQGPEGPLDEPRLPPEMFPSIPKDYWKQSARTLFKASHSLTDLLRTCEDRGILVVTPLSMFAAYQVTVCGLYCLYFSWMDPDRHYREESARRGFDIVKRRINRMRMVDNWWGIILRLDNFYRDNHKATKQWRSKDRAKWDQASESSGSSGDSSGIGGGLEEYKRWEKDLKEFGDPRSTKDGKFALNNADVKGPEEGSDDGDIGQGEAVDTAETARSVGNTPGSPPPHYEPRQEAQPPKTNGWQPVNGAPNSVKPEQPVTAPASSYGHGGYEHPHPSNTSAFGQPPQQPQGQHLAQYEPHMYHPTYPQHTDSADRSTQHHIPPHPQHQTHLQQPQIPPNSQIAVNQHEDTWSSPPQFLDNAPTHFGGLDGAMFQGSPDYQTWSSYYTQKNPNQTQGNWLAVTHSLYERTR